MTASLRIAMAQVNLTVGDVAGNTRRMLAVLDEARAQAAQLVLFPELSVCGYPPEDLLFHAGLRTQVSEALATLGAATAGISAMIGYPEYVDDQVYNSAAVFCDGRQIANYRKQCLPNYSVFDEERYFESGTEPCIVSVQGIRLGLMICEDVWEPGPCRLAAAAGAQAIVAINGSPFKLGKQSLREAVLAERAVENDLPVVYQNLVGGQD